MRGFVWGLLLGALVCAPLAYNFGRGVPLLSNPLAETPRPELTDNYEDAARRTGEALKESAARATERVQAVAEEAAEELRRAAAEASEQVREAAREALEEARRAAEGGNDTAPEAPPSEESEPGSGAGQDGSGTTDSPE